MNHDTKNRANLRMHCILFRDSSSDPLINLAKRSEYDRRTPWETTSLDVLCKMMRIQYISGLDSNHWRYVCILDLINWQARIQIYMWASKRGSRVEQGVMVSTIMYIDEEERVGSCQLGQILY